MLVPSAEEAPDIIMAHGMAQIAEEWGTEPAFYAISQGSFLGKEAVGYLQKCIADKEPVTIIGGSFGFVNFIDKVAPQLGSLPLPVGSRVLDAGGFKGRSRVLTRTGFLEMMANFSIFQPNNVSTFTASPNLAVSFTAAVMRKKNRPIGLKSASAIP